MITKEEQLKVKLVKKIFQEDVDFSDGLTFDCDIYDANGECIDTVRFWENIWDYFMDYLKMANNIIGENLKTSKDYMKKKIYYEIDYDEDGDASTHYIFIKCEDGIFPPYSLHFDVNRKSVADFIFHIKLGKYDEAPEYFITYKDLVENIKNIIEKNGEKYNEDLKKERKETLKLYKKEGRVMEDIEGEKKSMFKNLCNFKKCNKIIEKSKRLMEIETLKFKAL